MSDGWWLVVMVPVHAVRVRVRGFCSSLPLSSAMYVCM